MSKRIYFSPSTQEHNAGAIPNYIEETVMNEIADIAIPILKYNGFEVFRNDRNKDHIAAKNESNALGVDLHFALHSNAGGGEGTVIFYSGSTLGKKLATAIYNRVAPLTPSKDRGIQITKVFTEVVKTIAPACLLEVAFHDNVADAKFIVENREKIAIAICQGICDYFGVDLKLQPKPVVKKVAYRVQVGYYGVEANAEAMQKLLKSKGFEAIIKEEEVK